jgi:FSR family fosmidomycin resistance protein-like MFS transporter
MSIFGVGGTLGFAVGPGLVTAALLAWGMKGTAVLALPTALLAGALAWHLAGIPIDQSGAAQRHRGGSPGVTHDAWGSFARLTAVVVARSVLFYGLNTFVPLYWIHVLGQSKAAGAAALTVFALASVCGNLLGGRLADRFGSAQIATVGFCALLPLVPALTMASSAPVALAILVLIGCALSTTYSPLIVLGQAYLPNHIGLSSGVTLGVAVSIGGVATPFLGRVADQYGLWATLAVLACVPLVSAGLSLTLPRPAMQVSQRP